LLPAGRPAFAPLLRRGFSHASADFHRNPKVQFRFLRPRAAAPNTARVLRPGCFPPFLPFSEGGSAGDTSPRAALVSRTYFSV